VFTEQKGNTDNKRQSVTVMAGKYENVLTVNHKKCFLSLSRGVRGNWEN